MTAIVQSVIKNSKKIINKIESKTNRYVLALLLTTGRKNYSSMANEAKQPYESVYVGQDIAAACAEYIEQKLISLVKQISTSSNPGKLIIDFTMIHKVFSEKIQGITYDYDGTQKRVVKGFSIGVASWPNGKITIPLTFSFWFRKKDALDAYKKKTTIAKDLIIRLKELIPFDEVLLDGAFASIDMLKFYTKLGLSFTIRIPRNRKIATRDGQNHQLQNHPSLRLIKNEKFKTINASIKGLWLFFTAHKRKAKNGTKEVVFIVSNLYRKPQKTVGTYAIRNNIEKSFRTNKQSLGLNDCQSRNIHKQRMHIFCAIYSYAILEIAKTHKKKKNPEAIIHILRRQKSTDLHHEYVDLVETIGFS